MQKLAFIFDLEGVLMEHLRSQSEITTRTLGKLGINYTCTPMHYKLRSFKEFHQTDDFLKGIIAMALFKIPVASAHKNPKIVLEHVAKLQERGIGESKIAEARKIFDNFRFSEGIIKAQSKRFLGAYRLLKYLKKNGNPVIVATFGTEGYARKLLERSKLMQFVDRLYCGNDDPKRNKDVLIAEALRDFKLVPGRTFVVEDSLSGLRFGKKLGLKTIGVKTGNTTKAMYAAEKDAVDFVIRKATSWRVKRVMRRAEGMPTLAERIKRFGRRR